MPGEFIRKFANGGKLDVALAAYGKTTNIAQISPSPDESNRPFQIQLPWI